MVDVIITTFNRIDLLRRTVDSLEKTATVPMRVFIADDGSSDGTQEYLADLKMPHLQFVSLGKVRHGIVYNFNLMWNLVRYTDAFYEPYPYLCYLQDDVVSNEIGWVETLIRADERFRKELNLGFLSGYDAPEHPEQQWFLWEGHRMRQKFSQSAQNLFAPKEFWNSVGQIPRLNPDGSERGFPSPGKGSHIDLYLTGCRSASIFIPEAAGRNCSYRQGKPLLVIDGLLEHIGQKKNESTWQKEKWSEEGLRLFQ